ncbi:MAG: bifunctional diaminohydroxyphosphoribosylaminopyrimidine deaminase/5-amino-6-(5-phosphoribosylamino)uracil reductase RibD [Bacteroidales bacterium]|nr:bifunctional diaminohydroxyphosphoribosylaminopyrimidine deaminase/5-amino-6-(5-phosphoribosylamino)uracil reductase RibD [Bacteroidales bacterium]
MKINESYMRRALELARKGEIGAHPNPMVGAVIVNSSGDIIGEGYHMTCGQAHAEVNAIANAGSADLSDSTIYVSLEPCAHYGKTPPCAQLIIDRKIPRVVIGTIDPFAKVCGRGIAMLREAGIEVTVLEGEIADSCRKLNRRFFTAHTLLRPYIALKWAQTTNGFVDNLRTSPTIPPLKISTPKSQVAVHRYRSGFDAISCGSNTLRLDRPRLDTRLWPGGRDPKRVTFTRGDLFTQLSALYADGITSILIEGGPTLQKSFIDANLWDEIRIETADFSIPSGIAAPTIPKVAKIINEAKNIKILLNNHIPDLL